MAKCPKCEDTGERDLTEEEMDEGDYDGYDPEDTMIPTTTYCECEAGQARQHAFWSKWGPIIAKAVNEEKGME